MGETHILVYVQTPLFVKALEHSIDMLNHKKVNILDANGNLKYLSLGKSLHGIYAPLDN